jgi:hypothetical protein
MQSPEFSHAAATLVMEDSGAMNEPSIPDLDGIPVPDGMQSGLCQVLTAYCRCGAEGPRLGD